MAIHYGPLEVANFIIKQSAYATDIFKYANKTFIMHIQ